MQVHNTGNVDLSKESTESMEEEQRSSGDWLPSNLDLILAFFLDPRRVRGALNVGAR